nr:pentatricopeptide repeat protein AaPPR795 [Agave angustifolia]
MYTNFGVVEAADLLFESLSLRRTVVSWNALMTGYRNCSLFRDVMALFDQMKREGHKPNSVTLLNLLPSCETKLRGKSVHAFAIRNSIELESSVLTSTMCMYARFEDFSTCRLIFEMMDKENVVSWNAVMSIYAESKDTGRALTSFKEMLGIGVEPDTVTMRTLASACSQMGSPVLAQSVTGFAIRKGFDKNTVVINALIDMNARCGSSSFARELFDRLESKDSVTWSTMINAYGVHGDGEAALRLFYMMQETGVQPDDITFVSILSACSHSGLVEQGRVVFESMAKEHGIRPKAKHLACVVDLLGRAGHLDEAYEIVRKMSYNDKPCTEMLKSLLGACRSHGDARVGEAIGKLALELCPSGASSHVMLSNIYAMGQRWMDSGRLRGDMGGRGLKKDPGFSLVQ